MAYELKMPQLGLTMEEGTVSKWVKKEGDAVKIGDVILEITTDKLTNEVVSEVEGTLLQIVAQEGDDVPVKGTLAWIGQAGEAVGAAPAAPAAGETAVNSPMPGNIFKVECKVGQAVNAGDVLIVLEAMKMEIEVSAPCAGTVKAIAVNVGGTVNTDDLLVTIG